MVKFNIAYPQNGTQKTIEVDDDKKCSIFFDRRMGQEVTVQEQLNYDGLNWNGYTFKIMGGNDKQGFAMKQGVLLKGRTKLLLQKGMSLYRPRRTGERKRKTVRGCIVGSDIRALFLSVVQKGENEIPGLTDDSKPRRLGPKRANNIRKMFGLTKEDPSVLLQKSVIRRTFKNKDGKERQKAPKIQRLITTDRIRNKAKLQQQKKSGHKVLREYQTQYQATLAEYRKQKAELAHKKSEARKASLAKEQVKKEAPVKKEVAKTQTKTAGKKAAKK